MIETSDRLTLITHALIGLYRGLSVRIKKINVYKIDSPTHVTLVENGTGL